MDIKKRSPDGLRSKLPLLTVILCLMQPILDVAGYWESSLQISNAGTLVLRMILLVGSGLLGFVLAERKRPYWLTAAILGLLTAGHTAACLRGGTYTDAVEDLVNLVRIYYLPVMTLVFVTWIQANDRVFPALQLGQILNLAIIALVQLLSRLTGTDPNSYADSGVGVMGWFLCGNSQSAVLSMLVPLALCWAVGRRPLTVILVTLGAELTLFFLGTRLAFACMAAGGILIGGVLLLIRRELWRQALAVLLVTLGLLACYPLSQLRARQELNTRLSAENAERRAAFSVTQDQVTPEALSRDPALKEEVLSLYSAYVRSSVDRFGFDRVLETYDYTVDSNVLGNTRTIKQNFCRMLMQEAGGLSRIFGLNRADMWMYVEKGVRNPKTREMQDGWVCFDVEYDFAGIYFLTGWAGLTAMVLFLLYFGLRAGVYLIRDLRRRLTPELLGFVLAYGFCLVHAVFTASVLRRPNASFYLAAVLAGLWGLTAPIRKRKEAEPQASGGSAANSEA